MKSLCASTNKPKVVCVCFNPLINPNERQDDDDVDAIWTNPPPAHALDVASLLKQLGTDIIITGFIPKNLANKQLQNFKQQSFATEFIEIDNLSNTIDKSTASYSSNPFVVTDAEKKQFIELMIQFVEQQTHIILFTGDLPNNFTLQDFKILVKRLRGRNRCLFIEMNDKVVNVAGTYLDFIYQHLDRSFQTEKIAWLKKNKLELYCTGDISDSHQRFEIAFTPFERRNPKHTRSAIFATLIFIIATNSMHSKVFDKKISEAYKEAFRLMNSADSEHEKNEILDVQTMRLLNIKNTGDVISSENIMRYLASIIIHTVSEDTLVLPNKIEIESYQDYFSIENLDK